MVTSPILPILYGFSITKKPIFATIVQSFKSGREVLNPQQQFPLFEFELHYETLKDQTQNQEPYTPNAGYTALETLSSIFVFCNGQYGRFLYEDLTDNSRSGQGIAIGDGATTQFNIVETITDNITGNNFTFTVGSVNLSHSVVVYVNGTPVPSAGNWQIVNGNLLVFASAPAPGAVITMDFFYYYSCRFIADEQDFEQFVKNWWTAGLKFRSTGSGVANPVPILSGWAGTGVSTDGTHIVMAASYEGPGLGGQANGWIWISNDKGVTFIKNLAAGPAAWGRVSMSANAQYILVAKNPNSVNDYLLVLSQDGGGTWAEISPGAHKWGAFNVSQSGQYMIACAAELPNFDTPTNFWYSTDFGTTWTSAPDVTGAYTPEYVAVSNNGQLGWFAQNNFPATNKILHSTNGGASWAGVSAFPLGPSTFGNEVTGDGTKVMAAAAHNDNPFLGSFFCTSLNSGATWTAGINILTPEPTAATQAWCSSNDGSIGYAIYEIVDGPSAAVHITNDWWLTFGGNVGPSARPSEFSWNGIFCSYDGLVVVIADAFSSTEGQGAIWISRDGASTWTTTVPADFT